jgi:hypothetical protein
MGESNDDEFIVIDAIDHTIRKSAELVASIEMGERFCGLRKGAKIIESRLNFSRQINCELWIFGPVIMSRASIFIQRIRQKARLHTFPSCALTSSQE